jgi:hypothetical protein
MAIRDGLFALRDFYRARLGEYEDPDLLMDDIDRLAATRGIKTALESVERRLAIGPT